MSIHHQSNSKQSKFRKWLIATLLLGSLGTGIYFWAQSKQFNDLTCNFRVKSPADFSVPGPFLINKDWQPIELPQTMRAVAHVQNILLMADGHTYYVESGPGYWYQRDGKLSENVRDTPNVEYRELEGTDRFQSVVGGLAKFSGGKAVTLEVKIEDNHGKQIQLMQSTLGRAYLDDREISNPYLGFSLLHDHWDKYFFRLILKLIKFSCEHPLRLI